MTSRRELLRMSLGLTTCSLASLAMSAEALAFGERERVGVHYLDLGTGAHARPRAAEQLMWELGKRTSVNTREAPRWVQLKADQARALYEAPLLIWLGEGPCPTLSDEQRAQLSQYLRAGGTLFIDDISAPGDERFDQSVRRELARLWPERALSRASLRSLPSAGVRSTWGVISRTSSRRSWLRTVSPKSQPTRGRSMR